MAIDFRHERLRFDPTAGGRTGQTLPMRVDFTRPVVRARAAVAGFDARFTRGDRNLHQIQIDVNVERIERDAVVIVGTLALRDASGRFDDEYHGWIDALIIAEVEDRPARRRPSPPVS
ncbi:MAG: hypothetical protein ACRDJE_10465 [Dehalococcoidia bacterium]